MNSTSCKRAIRLGIIIMLLIFVSSLSHIAYAGKLGDFENDVTSQKTEETKKEKKKKKQTKVTYDSNDTNDTSDSIFADILFGIFKAIFRASIYSIASNMSNSTDDQETSWEDISEPEEDIGNQEIEPYPSEDIEIPMPADNETTPETNQLTGHFRFNLNYLHVDSDIQAIDGEFEATFGINSSIGLGVRHTSYKDHTSSESLILTKAHGMLYYCTNKKFNAGVGYGMSILNGTDYNSGWSFIIPFRFIPSESLPIQFEFRPSWWSVSENTVGDYDAAILLGKKNAFIRIGHRWMRSDNTSLNSPYVGFFLQL